MGILQRRHLSNEGHVIASALQSHCEREAGGLEMVANRLNLLPDKDEEMQELVEYIAEAAARTRAITEDL